MQNSFQNREHGISQNKIEDFKKMLGYLNINSSTNDSNIDNSIKSQIKKTLSGLQKARNALDNPDEIMYEKAKNLTDASEVAGLFGLSIDPSYFGKGIGVVNGHRFVEFLSNISLDELRDNEFKKGIESLLMPIKQVYGYTLEKSLDNNKFDNFDELAKNWGDIEKQYTRLGMDQQLKNFDMSPYVNAYAGGYLRALLGLKKLAGRKGFLWDDIISPFKVNEIHCWLEIDDHKNDLDDRINKIVAWAEKEVGHQESSSLIKYVLGLYMQTIDKNRLYFQLSDDKVEEILGKFKEVLSKF